MPVDVDSLRDLIRDIADYPKPGVTFRDITPLLGDPEAFGRSINALVEMYVDVPVDRVIGVEARGFIIAAPVAYRIGAGFVRLVPPCRAPTARRAPRHEHVPA